jgi:hypothetical protein
MAKRRCLEEQSGNPDGKQVLPSTVALASYFRPWLDDPGAWPAWDLTVEERGAFAEALSAAGMQAVERLRNLYGEQADTFGAATLAEALAADALPEADLQRAALAISACDHHRLRCGVPRAAAGDLTSPSNSRRWTVLRPYLVARCLAMLRGNAVDALMWRAISGRIADDWVQVAQLTRNIQQELSASGLFDEVAVTLELNPPVAGGGRWIAMQSKSALAELRRRLAAREACLVELIRDAETSPPGVDLVVVYRLEDELTLGRDGVDRVRLWIYDPHRGGTPASLRLTLADDGVQAVEWPADPTGRATVKALRLVRLEDAEPPLAGWRRWLRPAHPWGVFWWLKRVFSLRLARRREDA